MRTSTCESSNSSNSRFGHSISFTPGAIIPARELLAEMLVDLGKGDEALVEAEHNLRDAPNRLNGLWIASLAAEKAGKSEAAQSYKARLQSRRAAATKP